MFERYVEIQRRRRQGGEGGFTLIELLIVIVVLGILAAIVVFALGGITQQSAQSACNADAKSVEVAVSAYQAQTGSFPDAGVTGQGELVGKYLRTWPSNASHYAVTLGSGGTVLVTPTSGIASGTAVDYDNGSTTPPVVGGDGAVCATVN